jgi:aminopeptidase-like protein
MSGSEHDPMIGDWLYRLATELYPICRSITGDGVRQTLRRLQQEVPLELVEVPTGTPVFDWSVPNEWNIDDAWIADGTGRRVVDFAHSNLHVVSYSRPVHRRMTLAELGPHLHTLPDRPDWIPYRTAYHADTWGFCLTHRRLESLADGEYEVRIDARREPGHLTYGELVIPGDTPAEALISAHCCHPSLANDNLSGMVVAVGLARELMARARRRYTYRFLWAPGTIGAITWLARHEALLPQIRHGLVLSCVGDAGAFTYKRSRRGHTETDRVVEYVLRAGSYPHRVVDFSPLGYDERQFGSPGINLPVGCFMRTPNGEYPEYHASADDLSLVTPVALQQSAGVLQQVVEVLESNRRYVNRSPKGEPHLGRRGLYRAMGGTASDRLEEALLWVLNFSDGEHSLLDIAERSGIGFASIRHATERLMESGLLGEALVEL